MMVEIEVGESKGWVATLKHRGVTVNHGYTVRSLATTSGKATGYVSIRSTTSPFAYLVDADATTINAVPMTAPLTPTTELVYTVYPGTNSTGEFQAILTITFPDPADATKTIKRKIISHFIVNNNAVA